MAGHAHSLIKTRPSKGSNRHAAEFFVTPIKGHLPHRGPVCLGSLCVREHAYLRALQCYAFHLSRILDPAQVPGSAAALAGHSGSCHGHFRKLPC